MFKSTPKWLSWAFMGLLLGVGLMLRFQGNIRAPLEEDELLNVRRYSTIDYQSDAETIRKVAPFDFVRTAKGIVKCFYTPWTPNNHLVNSLLMSVSSFFFSPSET